MENFVCLVIEQDEDDRDFFWEAIKLCCPGVSCEFADDFKSALDKLVNGKIEIPKYIFVDWRVPTLDLTVSLKLFNAIDEIKDSSVFILTAALPQVPLEVILQTGVKGILLKQNSITELATEISAALC